MILSILSGTGGVGKSTFCVNIATALAMQQNKVLILDLNQKFRMIDLYLGIENLVMYDLNDYLEHLCQYDEIKRKIFTNLDLYVILSRQNFEEKIDNTIEKFISDIKSEFDFIIINLPSGYLPEMDKIINITDLSIMISTTDFAVVRNTQRLEDEIIKQGARERYLILNKMLDTFHKEQAGHDLIVMEDLFRTDILGFIPYDINIRLAANAGIPISIKTDTYISKNFEKMALKIIKKQKEK